MDKEQAVSYVQLLQGYIDQTSQYINQYLPYPKDGSPGYIELENFSRQESVHTSHSLGSTLIETSADHMQALVKTLTEPVQAFAPWVCLRSVLESSALAYWILDNNIDIRTRVKRGFALRYKGLVQQINIARAMDDVGFENRINEQIEKVEKTALQLGYDKILNRNNNRIGIGVGMPSFTEIVKITFNAEGVYRYLSSISHSHHWAIKQVGFQEVNADEVEIKTMPSTRKALPGR